MDFEIVGSVSAVETIALVQLDSGETFRAEIHWYEATGIGRREAKIKRRVG